MARYKSPLRGRTGPVNFENMYTIPSSGYADPVNMAEIDRDELSLAMANSPLFAETPRQFIDYSSLPMPMGQPMQEYMSPPMDPRGLNPMEDAINPLPVDFSGATMDTGFNNLGMAPPAISQGARLSMPAGSFEMPSEIGQPEQDPLTGHTRRLTAEQRAELIENMQGPRPAASSRMDGGSFISNLGAYSPYSREGQQRESTIKAHMDFIRTHPPGSEDFNTYRQRLIDSGIFESDHIMADKAAYTPGAPGPMTLPDALRLMYNVPKGQEIKRNDIQGRAKNAAIKARRQEKSQAHKEVMRNFGGDYSQYDKWWNSLPSEARPETWEEARDALRLASVGQSAPGVEGRGTVLADSYFPSADSGSQHFVGPPAPMQSIDPGRESLMSLSQGEIPEQFASQVPAERLMSMEVEGGQPFIPQEEGGYYPPLEMPSFQRVTGHTPGEPIQSLPFSDYMPREDRLTAGQEISQLPSDDVYDDFGLYGSEKAEAQRIMEQARYGDPFAGAPDIKQFLADEARPTMRQATPAEASVARRGGSLAESFNEWNSVKDQLAQATMFDMHVPQEVKDIESRVKRDVSRVRRTLRQAPKRYERLMAFGRANNIDLQPVMESILRGHYVDVPGKNYQRQMGATQAQDAAGLFEDRGPAGARSEVNQQVMRVAASLPKRQRAQFLRQTEWLNNLAIEMTMLGASSSRPMRGQTADFNRFLDQSSSLLIEIENQVRGARSRMQRRRLRRQLKER